MIIINGIEIERSKLKSTISGLSSGWSVGQIYGNIREFSVMNTVMDFLNSTKDPESAKIFSQFESGVPWVIIVFKQ